MLERDAVEQIVTDVDECLPIDYDTGRVQGLVKSPEVTAEVIQYFKIEILKEIYELRSAYKRKWGLLKRWWHLSYAMGYTFIKIWIL